MAWNLATAKVYLKIDPADTSKDGQIKGIMDYVLGAVETVLQRGLFFLRQTVRFHYVNVDRLYLPRYPVATVFEVRDGNTNMVEDFTLHSRVGWLQFLRIPASPIEVDYDGGYQILPADLERAMWEAFMNAWGRTDSTTGGPLTEAGAAGASGAVKGLTVFDGFRIDYDVSAVVPPRDQQNWGWLAPWAGVFGFYRSEHGAELGMA